MEIAKEDLDPRVVKDLEKKIERMEKLVETYYGFFRMGGAINMQVYKSMDDVEKAACLASRKKIREEEAKFTMKCMMAVFDACFAKILDKAEKDLPRGPEEAVSKVLDDMEKPS